MKKTFLPTDLSSLTDTTAFIRVVLLQDDLGWVQVMLCVNALLDVGLVRQRLKRPNLSPITQETAIQSAAVWTRLPSLTVPNRTITLVDSNLTAHKNQAAHNNPTTQNNSTTQNSDKHGGTPNDAVFFKLKRDDRNRNATPNENTNDKAMAWMSEWIKHYEKINHQSVQWLTIDSVAPSSPVTLNSPDPTLSANGYSADQHKMEAPDGKGTISLGDTFSSPPDILTSASRSSKDSTLKDTISSPSSPSSPIISLTQRRLAQRIAQIQEIPPLPHTAEKIIKLRVDPKADINELTQIIENDPCLAAQVMSWASSPYYAPIDGIRSVHDAVVRVLGFDMVLNLSLGICLNHTVLRDRKSLFRRKGKTFGQFGVRCAQLTECLVSALPKAQRPICGLASLAGLVSELGELILMALFPPHYQQLVLLKQANPHINACDLERHCLGNTMNEISASLLDQWDLPKEVIIALQYQPVANEYEGKHAIYVHLLSLARALISTNEDSHPCSTNPHWRELAHKYHLEVSTLIKLASDVKASPHEE